MSVNRQNTLDDEIISEIRIALAIANEVVRISRTLDRAMGKERLSNQAMKSGRSACRLQLLSRRMGSHLVPKSILWKARSFGRLEQASTKVI